MTMLDTYTVRDVEQDRTAALLDELDSLIAALDAALAEQNGARATIADGELEMQLIAASLTLSTEGRNESERRARLTLALHDDPGYQACAATVRHARAALLSAERTITIIKARMALVKAALALLTPSRMGETE